MIEIGKKFIHADIIYTCVGHDNKMCWGINKDNIEAIPFDFGNCKAFSENPILGIDYCCEACG